MPKNIYQCKNCNQSFEPKDKRYNKFCSSSCSASYNNTGRIRSEKSKKKTSLALSGRKLSDKHKQNMGIARRQRNMIVTTDKCEYGCNNQAMFILANGKKCCELAFQRCPAMQKKNSDSAKQSYETGRKPRLFTDKDRMKSIEIKRKIAVDNFLYRGILPKRACGIKHVLFELIGIERQCQSCHLTEWLGKPINLELDHINGNNKDNRLENLRFLCPNCHSQTPTWRGSNIIGNNIGKKKVSDEALIEAYKQGGNIRQALLLVGLIPKGGNYKRVKRLIGK